MVRKIRERSYTMKNGIKRKEGINTIRGR